MQKVNSKTLGDVLVDLDYTTNELILKVLGEYLGLDVISFKDMELSQDLIERIPYSVAQLYHVLPIDYEDTTLTLAVAQDHALDIAQVDDLRFLLPYNLKLVLIDIDEIVEAMEKYYPVQQVSMGDLMDKFSA